MSTTQANPLLLASEERDFLRRLIRNGWVLRLAIAVVLNTTPYAYLLAPDEATYTDGGWTIALYWKGDLTYAPTRLLGGNVIGYFYVNAFLFSIFGQTTIPILLLNTFIGASACRYVYYLARSLHGPPVARLAALLMQYFPSLILWSAVNIRDVWVVSLILYISWQSHLAVEGHSSMAVGKIVVAIGILTQFREYLFMVVALPPILAMLVGRTGNLVRNFIFAAVVMICLAALSSAGALGGGERSSMSLERLAALRTSAAHEANSGYYEGVDISTPAGMLSFLPLALAYFFFSPFPWQITSLLKVMSVPEMLLIYALTLPGIRGISFAFFKDLRRQLQLLLLMASLTVSYALAEGNVGTLYRHRSQAVGFYLIMAAAGWEKRTTPSVERTRAPAG